MRRTMTKLGLPWIAIAGLVSVGCTRENPIFGDDGSTGALGTSSGVATEPGGGMDTTRGGVGGSGSSTQGPPSTAPDTGVEPSTTTEGPGDATTGASLCPLEPPVASATSYAACPVGICAEGQCLSGSTDGAVQYGLSVCAGGCEQTCECPVPPTGEAVPMCHDAHCQLDCSGGKACPEGMVCVDGAVPRCMWANLYGPCDDTCLSGKCFMGTIGAGGGICPLLSCSDLGAPVNALCPLPPSGLGTPECLGEAISPEQLGWCVLSCEGGGACPPGMFCDGIYCLYN